MEVSNNKIIEISATQSPQLLDHENTVELPPQQSIIDHDQSLIPVEPPLTLNSIVEEVTLNDHDLSSDPNFGLPNVCNIGSNFDEFQCGSLSTMDFNEYECKPFVDIINGDHGQGNFLDTFYNGNSMDLINNNQMNCLSLNNFQEMKPSCLSYVVPDEVSSVSTNNVNLIKNSKTMSGPARRRSLRKLRNGKNVVKDQWTLEEDKLLVQLVGHYGERKWSYIAQMLPGRIGKQCRERWLNHLRPDIKKDVWTAEEDKQLIQAHTEIGNKWAEIAKRLPGRTENSIKNHWNATKRRQFSKRKWRSKHPRSTLLEDYIKSLNLDPNGPGRSYGRRRCSKNYQTQGNENSASAKQAPAEIQLQQGGLDFDRLVQNCVDFDFGGVPDFSFDDGDHGKVFQDSIDRLLEDTKPLVGEEKLQNFEMGVPIDSNSSQFPMDIAVEERDGSNGEYDPLSQCLRFW